MARAGGSRRTTRWGLLCVSNEDEGKRRCVTWGEFTPHLDTLKEMENEVKTLRDDHREQVHALRDIKWLLVILIVLTSPTLASGVMTLMKATSH